MAILVAVGGAVLGSAIGVGWSTGWLVGGVLGSLIFPNRTNIKTEGPRLGDLTVTSSAYGTPVAIGYGTLRMAGNMIWSSGIREEKTVKRSSAGGGKGGGGAKQTSTTYSYFASFAIAFGEGPAVDILRIWADGKLIVDKTGANADSSKPNLKYRFHPGDETQLPDPLIEADAGAGRAMAHRGLCYAVFEDLPLADYGNRIPNITAEIAFATSGEKSYQTIDFITAAEGGYFSSYQGSALAVDWRRGYGYFLQSDADPALAGIRRFDLRTMREDRQARMSDVTSTSPNNFPQCIFSGTDGYLYIPAGAGNSVPILRVEPNAFKEVARFGSVSSGLDNTSGRFVSTRWMGMISSYGPDGRTDFLLAGSLFNDIGVLRASDMAYVWGAGTTIDEARVRGVVGGFSGEGAGEGWVLGSGTGTHTALGLYRIRVASSAFGDEDTGETIGVAFEKLASLLPSDIEAGATAFWQEAGGLTYDTTDGGVIFQVQIADGGSPGTIYTVKWRTDLGIVWKTAVPIKINYEGPFFGLSRLERSRWTLMRATRLVQLDTATGAIVTDDTWPFLTGEGGAQIYDAIADALIVHGPNGWERLALGGGAAEGATVSSIVTDLCGRAGLLPADIDTVDLDDVVPGFFLGRQASVRDALSPLAQGFFFDAVESDDVLRFKKRGASPVATVSSDLLIVLDERSGESWRERRTQEVELPERVNIIYMDRDADYGQGTQGEKRVSLPLPTMHSRMQASLELPAALDATTAKRIAARTLYAAWMERSNYEAQVPTDFLRLDPADVVDVVFPSGTSFRTRLTRVDVGADFSLSLKGVSERAAVYVSSVSADGGAGHAPGTIPGQAATKLILPDLPLLRDVDDLGGTGSRAYVFMGGFGTPSWPGAALYKSADGASWSQVGRSLGEVAWGATANALGLPISPFATDEANALTVFMTVGGDRVESVTQTAMLNGANGALVLKANGEPEIVQFRDVAANPDGSFTLSGLLRGRRGTDVFVDGHAPGELFVLLDAEDIESLGLSLGELGLTRLWRAVGFGTLFEDADILSRVHTGSDLKPYAPWSVTAAKSGTPSDIVLSWVRRTRIGGELKDGTGIVPLGEASEAYEVDILDAPGGVVKRTLSSASPTITYANADILTDFGAVPDTLPITVYQMSAVGGRGFPRAVTLDVT